MVAMNAGEGEIVLMAVGDIALEEQAYSSVRRERWKATAEVLRQGHIVFGNLECPLSANGKPIRKVGPHLRGVPESADELKLVGFTLLNLANNHIYDYGREGLLETIEALWTRGIASVGVGMDRDEAEQPFVKTVNGVPVAVLGFCDRQESVATKRRPGAAEIRERVIHNQFEALKKTGACLVVSLHTGIEFVDFPAPHTVAMCRRLIDRGATVVLGHHPHVPQGYERYRGGVIVYSLGNFSFDMGEETPTKARIGYIYRIAIKEHGVEAVTPIPYRMDDYYVPQIIEDGQEKKALLEYLERLSGPLQDNAALEAIWYVTSRYYTRQLIKALLYRTFKQHRLFFPRQWLGAVLRPQDRKTWLGFLRRCLSDRHNHVPVEQAFLSLTLR